MSLVEQAKVTEESLGPASKAGREGQTDAKEGNQSSVLLPNTPGMCRQVAAFGLEKGIYLRTDPDIWLAQNQKLTGLRVEQNVFAPRLSGDWLPHVPSPGLEVCLVGEGSVLTWASRRSGSW